MSATTDARFAVTRVGHGLAAIRAGDPDHAASEAQTSLADALANIMLYADVAGLDFDEALDQARGYFNHESSAR